MSEAQTATKTKTIKLIGGPRDGEIDVVEDSVCVMTVPWVQPDRTMKSTTYSVDFVWWNNQTIIELWLWEELERGEAAELMLAEYKKPPAWKPREVAKAMGENVAAVLNSAIGLDRIDPNLILLIKKTITQDLRKLKAGQL